MNEKPHNNPNYKAPEMKYRQGDIIVNGRYYRRIIAVIGEVYVVTYSRNFYESAQEECGVSGVLYSQRQLDEMLYHLAEEPTPEPETIEVLGKTYNKSDVEEKLAGLEEAE